MDHAPYAQNVDWRTSGAYNCPGFCGRVVNETAVTSGEWVLHHEFGDCKVILFYVFLGIDIAKPKLVVI